MPRKRTNYRSNVSVGSDGKTKPVVRMKSNSTSSVKPSSTPKVSSPKPTKVVNVGRTAVKSGTGIGRLFGSAGSRAIGALGPVGAVVGAGVTGYQVAKALGADELGKKIGSALYDYNNRKSNSTGTRTRREVRDNKVFKKATATNSEAQPSSTNQTNAGADGYKPPPAQYSDSDGKKSEPKPKMEKVTGKGAKVVNTAKGKLANVTKEQLRESGLSLKEYMNYWNAKGKRPIDRKTGY